MAEIFRKIKATEVEFAKSLIKKAFPNLKYVHTMKRDGSDVFYFGQFKIELSFPKVYDETYTVSVVKYEGRWAYCVECFRSKDEHWSDVEHITRWVHPDNDYVYDDEQILVDEYKTLPYLYELKERHGL